MIGGVRIGVGLLVVLVVLGVVFWLWLCNIIEPDGLIVFPKLRMFFFFFFGEVSVFG